MKLEVYYTGQFKKDFKQCQKRRYNMELLRSVMELLENNNQLPLNKKDHLLSGNYSGYRECHVQSDWLLIYQLKDTSIVFDRTGTHSDLF